MQQRLYNILCRKLLEAYLPNGDARQRAYAINNTVYRIAEYFGWIEIIRKEIQFLDLGEEEQTKSLTHLQAEISSLWSSDKYGATFRVFAGEQRAIGERMIRES